MRVASAFAVVLLHSNEGIWMFSYESYWWESTVVFLCLYWTVPCFIMMSGALLIDYPERYSTKTFIKKRVQKVLIPYIAWCLIGIVYLAFYNALTVTELNAKIVIQMIISNKVLTIYWYLTQMFTVYLITPVLAAIPEDKKRPTLEYIIASMLILSVTVPFITSFVGFGAVDVQMPLTTLCLYYVAGYYIDRYLSPEKIKMIYVLALGGFLLLLLGTITVSYKAGSLVQIFMGYINLPCVFFSLGVFCLFKQLFDRQTPFQPSLLPSLLMKHLVFI